MPQGAYLQTAKKPAYTVQSASRQLSCKETRPLPMTNAAASLSSLDVLDKGAPAALHSILRVIRRPRASTPI